VDRVPASVSALAGGRRRRAPHRSDCRRRRPYDPRRGGMATGTRATATGLAGRSKTTAGWAPPGSRATPW